MSICLNSPDLPVMFPSVCSDPTLSTTTGGRSFGEATLRDAGLCGGDHIVAGIGKFQEFNFPKTNMTMENPPFGMYFLVTMRIFQCHVSFQEVHLPDEWL